MSRNFEKLVKLASKTAVSVLILGPTGSGKTRLAKRMHEESPRATRPFVTVNLAVLHEGTLEAELFGHERGAFTGADTQRKGRLAHAQGGTVFLDEIGELSPKLQVRLLDFLQFGTVTPLGSHQSQKLDVRVIAATNRNLQEEVKAGRFREDLFHRLRVIEIKLPSLLERRESFNEIVHDLIEELSETHQKKILNLTEEAAARMETYDWPGNIRELKSALEYAVIHTQDASIKTEDFPDWIPICEETEKATLTLDAALMGLPLREAVDAFEKAYLLKVLERSGGGLSATARLTSLPRATLLRRLRYFGLHYGSALHDSGVLSQDFEMIHKNALSQPSNRVPESVAVSLTKQVSGELHGQVSGQIKDEFFSRSMME